MKYDSAIYNHNKALEFGVIEGDSIGLARTYNNLGVSYFNDGDLDLAKNYFKLALDIRILLKQEEDYGESYNNLGEVYRTMGSYDTAFDHYDLAMRYHKENNNLLGQVYTLESVGTGHLDQGRLNSALTSFNKGLQLSKSLGSRKWTSKFYKNMAAIAEKKGDYGLALEYSQSYKRSYDSLLSAKKIDDIQRLKDRFELEKKEIELARLEKEYKLAEKESQLQKVSKLWWGALFFTFPVIIFSF